MNFLVLIHPSQYHESVLKNARAAAAGKANDAAMSTATEL